MSNYAAKQVTTRARRPVAHGGDPILAAKITAPGVPDWALARPRITKLIAEGTRWHPLTVVTGPVGAGKTMALTLWSAAEAGPVAWLSLDEYDNRPGVFWPNVVAALRESGIAVPRTLPAPGRGRAGEHPFLLRLASALAAHNTPVTLVLDDIHLLTEPRALAGLDFILRNVGPCLRLVVCSRSEPPLPLHRYRLAGELAEIRATDLAFTTDEATLLLAQHSCTLAGHSLDLLMERTEGWAAGLRLAAISMDGHPDPDQFVKELIAEDSALTTYLVEEVLHTQPAKVQNLLLNTSILEQVSPDAASELAGDDQAGRILAGLASTNTFVQPLGSGRYRYHTLLAEVLRLKLRHEHPGRVTDLHRRAAGWYQRRGALTEAVRHAKRADGWQTAASMVIDELAVIEIAEGRRPSLAQAFAHMPLPEAGKTPQLSLVSAAVALSAGGAESASAALGAAEGVLGQLPAEQHAAERLAASMIRLAAARRAGNLAAASAAAASAGTLVSKVAPGALARHPEIPAWVLCNRGAVALWSGHLDEAARLIESGLAAVAAPDGDRVRADCLGHLALVEALRGRLSRAAELAVQATGTPAAGEQGPSAAQPTPAVLVALAWVHLELGELPEAGSLLKQANAALKASPDKLLGALACLAAARGHVAAGQAALAAPYLASARAGWSVPAWLEQRLSLAERPAASKPARDQRHPPALARRHDHRPAPPSAPDRPAGPLIVEPLTQREREVLQHLSDMLSTAEVASEMFISINTVKAHVKNILRKLAAAHRNEAVRRARQLGLI